MRAAIYNPYLDTLGGGERYAISFAKILSENGHQVSVEWKDPSIKDKLENRFGMDLNQINFVENVKRGDGYDLCFWVSDGSIPVLRARKNFLHFQVPFHRVGGNSLLNKMKLIRIDEIICNSEFTKKVIDKEYGVESVVIYPPVGVEVIKPKKKENIILSVGRFSELMQSKRQDVLVGAFKKLFDGGLNDWKLILMGGVELVDRNYMKKLKKTAEGYPIEIIESPDFKALKEMYGKAKIFWSASGYSEDENKNPEKVEHFGMTVVEAMSASAVPLICNAGGHKEIVEQGVNGELWNKIMQLVRRTKYLVDNPKVLRMQSLTARNSAQRFSYERFQDKILNLTL